MLVRLRRADPQRAGVGDELGAGGEALGVVGREGDDDLATEPVAAVEFIILDGVNDVEADQPTDDGEREHDGCDGD